MFYVQFKAYLDFIQKEEIIYGEVGVFMKNSQSMTSQKSSSKYTEDWLLKNEGKQFPLTIIAIGKSEKACALQVEMDDIPCSNNLRHITVSVAPNGKPVDSNNILDWHNIKPFTILTTIKIYKKQ